MPISSKSTLALMVSFVCLEILSNVPIRFHICFSQCASHQGYVSASEMTNTTSPTKPTLRLQHCPDSASFSYLEVEDAFLV
jgi:hypothetical protein